jgi:acyl-CoA thioesterase I
MHRLLSLTLLLSGFLSIASLAPSAFAQTPAAQARSTEASEARSKEDTKKVLVVFGDSISAGYGVAQGRSFPDDLQRKLDAAGYPWRVINMGVSGDTTQGGVARIKTAIAAKPSMVLLELGGNDGLRGLPLAAARANLDQMIAAFEHNGAKVVLAGMKIPPNYGPDYTTEFEKMYSDLAAKYKLTFISFIMGDMMTPDLHYFQPDHIHPTAEGAEIVATTVLTAIKPLLGASRH